MGSSCWTNAARAATGRRRSAVGSIISSHISESWTLHLQTRICYRAREETSWISPATSVWSEIYRCMFFHLVPGVANDQIPHRDSPFRPFASLYRSNAKGWFFLDWPSNTFRRACPLRHFLSQASSPEVQ